MVLRKTILAIGQIYHVFNRGVDKRAIFLNNYEYHRFFDLIRYYQQERPLRFSYFTKKERELLLNKKEGNSLVEIFCYCLMPNHFHLLLKQKAEGGITQFMRRVSDSYGRYFNLLHQRIGPLFQGNFKAVMIEDNDQLLHISRYIHLNPLTSNLVKNLDGYPWSSYSEFLSKTPSFCSKNVILQQFRSPKQYQKFVLDHADYAKHLKEIEHLLIEEIKPK